MSQQLKYQSVKFVFVRCDMRIYRYTPAKNPHNTNDYFFRLRQRIFHAPSPLWLACLVDAIFMVGSCLVRTVLCLPFFMICLITMNLFVDVKATFGVSSIEVNGFSLVFFFIIMWDFARNLTNSIVSRIQPAKKDNK